MFLLPVEVIDMMSEFVCVADVQASVCVCLS